MLADANPRQCRGDRLKLAADLGRGEGLHVPQILMGRPPFEKEEDARSGPRSGWWRTGRIRSAKMCREQVGKGQPDGAPRTDPQQGAAPDTIGAGKTHDWDSESTESVQ